MAAEEAAAFEEGVHHGEDGLEEMTGTDHRLGENYAKNHPGGSGPQPVDREAFNKFREDYWNDPRHQGGW
ncbi:MAG TPA: hypothetical protein VMI31_04350 [Fimbriimonadaceae bacterium]|nr:hypothetical protein [Fimbriimonadaceae bacterium]